MNHVIFDGSFFSSTDFFAQPIECSFKSITRDNRRRRTTLEEKIKLMLFDPKSDFSGIRFTEDWEINKKDKMSEKDVEPILDLQKSFLKRIENRSI